MDISTMEGGVRIGHAWNEYDETFPFPDDMPDQVLRMVSDVAAKTGPALDANNPDLRPLRDRGGKVLLYHGWSDADISPLGTIAYYEEVVKLLGEGKDSATALAEV